MPSTLLVVYYIYFNWNSWLLMQIALTQMCKWHYLYFFNFCVRVRCGCVWVCLKNKLPSAWGIYTKKKEQKLKKSIIAYMFNITQRNMTIIVGHWPIASFTICILFGFFFSFSNLFNHFCLSRFMTLYIFGKKS